MVNRAAAGAARCCCVLVCGLCSGVWALKGEHKGPQRWRLCGALLGERARLSKRGHSFCLRSLAGPIQPPAPLQHPLSARSSRRGRGLGRVHGCPPLSHFLSLSSGLLSPDREPEPPHGAATERTGRSSFRWADWSDVMRMGGDNKKRRHCNFKATLCFF